MKYTRIGVPSSLKEDLIALLNANPKITIDELTSFAATHDFVLEINFESRDNSEYVYLREEI